MQFYQKLFVDFVTFIEEILNTKLHFLCSVKYKDMNDYQTFSKIFESFAVLILVAWLALA